MIGRRLLGLISAIRPSDLDKKLSGQSKEKISIAEVTPPAQSPLPCISCRGPFFWLNHYGQVRCLDCLPPPSRSLVRLPLWGIAGPPGGPWDWETLEDPPRVFRSGGRAGSDLAGDAGTVAGAADDDSAEPQVVAWEFPGPGGRLVYSVVGRSRVDRGTLHWANRGVK